MSIRNDDDHNVNMILREQREREEQAVMTETFVVEYCKGTTALDSHVVYKRVVWRERGVESPWMKSVEAAWARFVENPDVRQRVFAVLRGTGYVVLDDKGERAHPLLPELKALLEHIRPEQAEAIVSNLQPEQVQRFRALYESVLAERK